jgi:hypothetical protein
VGLTNEREQKAEQHLDSRGQRTTEVRQAHFGLDVADRFTETCERLTRRARYADMQYRMLARNPMLRALGSFNVRYAAGRDGRRVAVA